MGNGQSGGGGDLNLTQTTPSTKAVRSIQVTAYVVMKIVPKKRVNRVECFLRLIKPA
jgi:hypothetical protein